MQSEKRAGKNPVAEAQASPKAVSFDVLRAQIKAEVTRNAVEMVRAMIQNAKDGQHQAMKYLLEMVGLYPGTTDEESPREKSLGGILLRRLEIPHEPNKKTENERGPVSAPPDAVE
jgi:hypothetical protein